MIFVFQLVKCEMKKKKENCNLRYLEAFTNSPVDLVFLLTTSWLDIKIKKKEETFSIIFFFVHRK